MKRREFLAFAGSAAGFAFTPGMARASNGTGRRYRIFMVVPRDLGNTETGFQEYLARRNVDAEYVVRTTGGDVARTAAIVDEIKTTRPDLVYCWGTPTTLGILGAYDADPSRYVTEVPAVFATVTDPIGSRLVPKLQVPGRNVTGVMHLAPLDVQLNTLNAYRKVDRLGVIFNEREQNSVLNVKGLEKLTAERGIRLLAEPVPVGGDGQPQGAAIPGLVARLAEQQAGFLYIGPDTFVAVRSRGPLTAAAIQHRLPTFSATESIVRSSDALVGLFSTAVNVGRFAAFKAEQILVGGQSPAQIPIETLRRFSLLINMPVAHAIHVYPPISLLNLAEVRVG